MGSISAGRCVTQLHYARAGEITPEAFKAYPPLQQRAKQAGEIRNLAEAAGNSSRGVLRVQSPVAATMRRGRGAIMAPISRLKA